MSVETGIPSVEGHFSPCSPSVRAVYSRILDGCRGFGEIQEESKKTCIHLVNRTAFAGVATRRESLILTVKSDVELESPRLIAKQRTSARRWHIELRLSKASQVDAELIGWLERAYRLSG